MCCYCAALQPCLDCCDMCEIRYVTLVPYAFAYAAKLRCIADSVRCICGCSCLGYDYGMCQGCAALVCVRCCAGAVHNIRHGCFTGFWPAPHRLLAGVGLVCACQVQWLSNLSLYGGCITGCTQDHPGHSARPREGPCSNVAGGVVEGGHGWAADPCI